MARFAHFDHTAPSPQPIRGWFDTDLFNYGANMPAAADLLPLSDAQWEARMVPDPSGWHHKDGALLPPGTIKPPQQTTIAVPKAPVG
jgi:hypothetical protein